MNICNQFLTIIPQKQESSLKFKFTKETAINSAMWYVTVLNYNPGLMLLVTQ